MFFQRCIIVCLAAVGFTSCGDLESRVGETVSLEGVVPDVPWEHPVAPPQGYPYINYLDVNDDEQLVFYTRNPVNCAAGSDIEVRGRVVRVDAPAKGERPSHPDSTTTAFHIVAENWSCP